jgi:hypothetical protein
VPVGVCLTKEKVRSSARRRHRGRPAKPSLAARLELRSARNRDKRNGEPQLGRATSTKQPKIHDFAGPASCRADPLYSDVCLRDAGKRKDDDEGQGCDDCALTGASADDHFTSTRIASLTVPWASLTPETPERYGLPEAASRSSRRIGDAVAVAAWCADFVECGETVVVLGEVGAEVGRVGLSRAAVVELEFAAAGEGSAERLPFGGVAAVGLLSGAAACGSLVVVGAVGGAGGDAADGAGLEETVSAWRAHGGQASRAPGRDG